MIAKISKIAFFQIFHPQKLGKKSKFWKFLHNVFLTFLQGRTVPIFEPFWPFSEEKKDF